MSVLILTETTPTEFESSQRAERSRILKIALSGAVPLTCAGSFASLIILLFSDDPRVSLGRFLEYASAVFFGSLALAWIPVPLACKLSSQGRKRSAYLVASIPAALLALFVVLAIVF